MGGVKCKEVGVEQSSLGVTGAHEWRADYGRPDEQVKHLVKQTLASFKGARETLTSKVTWGVFHHARQKCWGFMYSLSMHAWTMSLTEHVTMRVFPIQTQPRHLSPPSHLTRV